MAETTLELKRALDDLSAVRVALERSARAPRKGWTSGSKRIHFITQVSAFVSALTILGMEVDTGGGHTAAFLRAKSDEAFMVNGLVSVGVFLTFALLVFYMLAWGSAKAEGEAVEVYLDRHFSRLANVSFAADLLVKFVTFSLVIVAGRPDWVGALFLLFTGDWLIQGRFFELPTGASLGAGVLVLLGGLYQISTGSPSVLPSLIVFSVVSAFSCYRVWRTPVVPSTDAGRAEAR